MYAVVCIQTYIVRFLKLSISMHFRSMYSCIISTNCTTTSMYKQ